MEAPGDEVSGAASSSKKASEALLSGPARNGAIGIKHLFDFFEQTINISIQKTTFV